MGWMKIKGVIVAVTFHYGDILESKVSNTSSLPRKQPQQFLPVFRV